MKIYFCGSIRAGRTDHAVYRDLIAHLKRFGTVLTEHVGNADLTAHGEPLSERDIHDRDMDWLSQSDAVIAEATVASLGVGYEIGRAVEQGKRILVLHRPQEERKLSAMLLGSAAVHVREYASLDEAYRHIDSFFAENETFFRSTEQQ
jgi:nucleoside 2-deoxyribosyltransferase